MGAVAAAACDPDGGGGSPDAAADSAGPSPDGGNSSDGAPSNGGSSDAGETGAAGAEELSLIAGGFGASGHLDGIGDAARLLGYGLAGDDTGSKGWLLGTGAIRELDLTTGALTTITGSYRQVYRQGALVDGPRGTAVVGSIIAGAYDSSANGLYFGDELGLRRLDVTTGAVQTVLATPSRPNGLAVDPVRHRLYMSISTCEIRVIDTMTGLLAETWGGACGRADGTLPAVGFASQGKGLALDRTANVLYVLDRGVIRIIDVTARTVVSKPLADGDLSGTPFLALDPASQRLYMAGIGAVLDVGTVAPPVRPVVRSVSPTSIAATGAATQVTISGYHFTAASQASIGTTTIPTSFTSETTLVATLPASATAAAQTLILDVTTPGVGFSTTTATVRVGNIVTTPSLSSLSSDRAPRGSGQITLGLGGSNFAAGGQAYLGATPLVTTVTSASAATATVPAALLGEFAILDVTFVNPAPGGGASGRLAFRVVEEPLITAGRLRTYGSDDGPPTAARFDGPSGLGFVATRGLYVADATTIRRWDGANVSTVAGRAFHGGATDGVGAAARVLGPRSIAHDPARNVAYVADLGNLTLREIDLATRSVTTIAGYPADSGDFDGAGLASRFHSPWGVTYDPNAKIVYVADRGNRAIRAYDTTTRQVSTIRNDLDAPTAVAYGGGSILYFVDGYAIRSLDIGTRVLRTLAGIANGGNGEATDGPGATARFARPAALAVDARRSRLYVADSYFPIGSGNPKVGLLRAVDLATGDVTTLAGRRDAVDLLDGDKTTAALLGPSGVALDATGNTLFVTDAWTLRSVDIETGAIQTRIGGIERVGLRLGPIATASFRQSVEGNSGGGLAFAGSDLLIVDSIENAILRARNF